MHAMASFKSSQAGVSILLVALLVCQAFLVPALARSQVVVGEKKLAEPDPEDMAAMEGHGGHGFGFGDHNNGQGFGAHGGPGQGKANANGGGPAYAGHGPGGHDAAGGGHRGGHI